MAVCRSVGLSICLSVCLSICLSTSLSACLSVCLSACLCVYLSVCLPACLPDCLSVCLFVCLSVCMSVCLSVCECVTVVVISDCESCTRRLSTNPGSMETGEGGLTRGVCFVARLLEVVAVAGLLWISWCALGAAGFFSCFLFFRSFFPSNTHGLLPV